MFFNFRSKNENASFLITLSLLLTMVSFSIALTSVQILMDDIIEEFSLLGANQGMTNAMFNFGSLIAVLSVIFIKGRVKKTAMLSLSAVAMAVSMFFIGYSPFFVIVLFFCLFAGTFGGWVDAYTNSMIMDSHRENSSAYIGALHASYALGAVLTPIAIHFLLLRFDWHNAYYILSLVSLLAALQFVVTARIYRKRLNVSSDEKRLSMREIQKFAGDKYNLLLIIACFFYSAAQVGQISWLVRYMNVNFPGSGIWTQITVSLYWLGVFVCRMTYPFIKADHLKMILFSLCAPAIAHAFAVLSGNEIVFIAATLFCGLTGGMAMPLLVNESLSRYRGNTSLALSGLYVCGKVGMTVMPALMGVYAVLSLDFSMLLADFSFLVSALIIFAAISVKKTDSLLKKVFFKFMRFRKRA